MQWISYSRGGVQWISYSRGVEECSGLAISGSTTFNVIMPAGGVLSIGPAGRAAFAVDCQSLFFLFSNMFSWMAPEALRSQRFSRGAIYFPNLLCIS